MARQPSRREATSAFLTSPTAHSWRAFGLPRTSGAAKPSKSASYAGCTATSCPCRCAESSVISTPFSRALPAISSQ